LNRLGLDAPVLPCPSIFARESLQVAPQEPEYVALNFMPLGGHFELGQDIDSSRWIREYADFARQIARRSRVVLVCHDTLEYEAASRYMPEIARIIATTAQEYLDIYSRAKYYIGLQSPRRLCHGEFWPTGIHNRQRHQGADVGNHRPPECFC